MKRRVPLGSWVAREGEAPRLRWRFQDSKTGAIFPSVVQRFTDVTTTILKADDEALIGKTVRIFDALPIEEARDVACVVALHSLPQQDPEFKVLEATKSKNSKFKLTVEGLGVIHINKNLKEIL